MIKSAASVFPRPYRVPLGYVDPFDAVSGSLDSGYAQEVLIPFRDSGARVYRWSKEFYKTFKGGLRCDIDEVRNHWPLPSFMVILPDGNFYVFTKERGFVCLLRGDWRGGIGQRITEDMFWYGDPTKAAFVCGMTILEVITTPSLVAESRDNGAQINSAKLFEPREFATPWVVTNNGVRSGGCSNREKPTEHIRSGHYRRQPVGPRGEGKRELIFIEKTIIGKEKNGNEKSEEFGF